MKIRPLQDRLIVKRVAEENKTKGGIIIPDTAKEKPLEVTVRLEHAGRIVNGQGADTDIIVASVKAYINALNRILFPVHREHPQAGAGR